MYGNVINKKQILELCQSGGIKISPFNESKLQTIHYPLNIKLIREYDSENELNKIIELKKGSTYTLEGNGYVIVEINERIVLQEGLVGEFVHSSNLIEKGLFLTCGKLDPCYGAKGEAIIFGLKNLREYPVVIESDLKLAYIKFYDLRALDNMNYKLSQEELKLWRSRAKRVLDDGVMYDE